MEFVRKVVNGVDLEGVVEMPNSLINRKSRNFNFSY